MRDGIIVRDATASDIPVLEIFEQAIIEAERPFDETLKSEGAKYYDLDHLIASPDVRFLVAESDGQLIASGYGRIEKSKTYLIHKHHAYLGFMYVLPEHRGKGVIRFVLDELYRWALSRGITELRLEVYYENVAAIRAYEKAGFSPLVTEMRASIGIRSAEKTELEHLAKIWYNGWQDAHAEILPQELKDDRTLESFRERLDRLLPDTRVIGPIGYPYGFCIPKGDELYQLYLSAAARGTGAAQQLMKDAEERLAVNGVTTAWLACAIGNNRAARFYEKCGWKRVGVVNNPVQLASGPFGLDVWRYEKQLF